MGGGGAIRAAAKFAGFNAGHRAVSPANHPIAAAARRAAAATRPAEEVSWAGLSASQSNNNPIDATAAQRPSWELDDWEFAGAEGDSGLVSGEPLPRLVFGAAPTLDEAKEATDELKHALDKIYLSSPNTTGYEEADHESALSLIPNPETKACVFSESTTNSLPTNALKAFRLLNESTAAQSVVASIASDPNVWHAVLQNEALSEFLQSQKSAAPLPDTNSVVEELVCDTIPDGTSNSSYGASNSEKSSNSGNWFVDFLEGLKSSVVEMKNDLADYIRNLFEGPTSVKENDASEGSTFMEKAMGASFFGLAVMVIMLVALKRPA